MSVVRLASGDLVAGYEVQQLVGRGGMGDVYEARDVRLERPVALKVLASALAEDDGFRTRLLRESRLAAALDHPNVVPIYEAGEDNGRLYIAMRFVDGTDLRAPLRREGPLAPERAIALVAQVADALDAAHAKGLVHRDVKPSNVLVDRAGGREHVYLADFGLTQSASHADPADGQGLGTIDYVSPEQIRGDSLDGRADQYALACLMFECLTGSLPHGRGSDVATLYAHLEEPPASACERRPGLPVAVDGVLARALAKRPEERFDSCAQLVAAARAALGLEPATSMSRRRKAVLAVGVALLAVLAATAAALVARSAPAPADASGGTILRIDPASNEVVAAYPVSATPGVVTTAGGRVWVGDFREGVLWKLEPRTGALERFTTTGEPRDITALGSDVYVASDGETLLDGTVTRYDAATGNRESGVRVLACSVAGGLGVVWVAGCPFIDRLSTDRGPLRIVREVRVPFQQPVSAENVRSSLRDMSLGEGALWLIGDPVDRRLFRADPLTGRLERTTTLAFAPRSVTAGEGAVWVSAVLDDVVARFDPTTGAVTATTRVPRGAGGVAAGFGSVWVASALDRSVSRLDPRTGRVVATIPVDGAPREVAVGAGGVWVTADAG